MTQLWRKCSVIGGLIVLTACSTVRELPDCEIPEAPAEAQRAVLLPELPQEVSSTNTTATFDLDGMLQLKRYRIASDTNTEVANLNAEALEARNESINALIECVRGQNIWMEIREDELEREKLDHFIDNLLHRGLIALGLVAVAL